MNEVQELIDGCGGREVSDVNGTSGGVGRVETIESTSVEVGLLVGEVESEGGNARLVETLLRVE